MIFDPLPRAVLLDVGFTLTFCDGHQIATYAAEVGVTVDPLALHAIEGALRAEVREQPGVALRTHDDGGNRWLLQLFRRMLQLSNGALDAVDLERAAAVVLQRHLLRNVWCRVGAGVEDALRRLRAAGLRLAVVSNSEGTVEAMLTDVGLRPYFDTVVDSAVVGVVKPDPRIFHLALDRMGIAGADAVMVGDSPTADVGGAHAAGARAALLDPHDLYQTYYPAGQVPRFRDLAGFVTALLASVRSP